MVVRSLVFKSFDIICGEVYFDQNGLCEGGSAFPLIRRSNFHGL